ncbi:MAG: Hsp70 family protein [Rhodobacteraceae bacterium]|nr:Hsp70 family protein [Paracoccaceae bacterium]
MDIALSNVLAIDFGTSNSAVAVFDNGVIKRLQMEDGSDTLPTAIFFDFSTGETRIGTPANDLLMSGAEGRYMRSLKRVLGTSLMREKRPLMGKYINFFDIIGGFLSELKIRAERIEGRTFPYALSGRPVRFHDDPKKDRQAEADLRECYRRAGFHEVEFMFEPEAASLANNVLDKDFSLGLIVDIGGGTSDFSVFRSNPHAEQPVEILASYGERFGGTDFDKTLNVQHFMPLLGRGAALRRVFGSGTASTPAGLYNDLATWEKIPFMYTPETLRIARDLERHALDRAPFKRLIDVMEYELAHELSMLAEKSKIATNQAAEAFTVDLGVIEKGVEISINPDDLDAMMANHHSRIIDAVSQTLTLATCKPDEITDVVFVGGSSLMGFVIDALTKTFPKSDFHTSAVFTAVVDGLALATARS